MRILKGLAIAALTLLLGSNALAEQAATPARVSFNIPQQPLGDALTEWSRQSGLQVLRRERPAAAELTSGSVSGEFSPEEALTRLLQKTGLGYEFVNERTVRITSAGADAVPTAARQAGETLILARIDDEGDAAQTPAGRWNEQENESAPQKGIPEILVRDRRGASSDIQRSEDDVQPYVVFTSEEIENSMAWSVESFMRTRLPMNQALNPDTTNFARRGGQSSIDLRGLGSDETLILVNGRRLPSIADPGGQDFFQPDINGIPLSSIERIEILPSTAGGIYGGGATGGVVNVILKRGYQGLEMRGTYDGTTHGGNHKRRLEASGGFSLEGGRTSINFSASYSDAVPLLTGDRDFIVDAHEQVAQNASASELLDFLGNPITGYTTNIQSVSGNPLELLSNGLSLGSARAHVPVGYAGPDSDNGLAFLNSTGFNTDLPKATFGTSGGTRSQVLSAPTVRAFSLNLRREFTDRIEAFVDLSNYDNTTLSYYAGTRNGNGTTIPAGPNNPFTEAVRITVPLTSLDRRLEEQRSWSESRTLAGGVIVRLPRNWSAQGEYSWSRSRAGYQYNLYQIIADGAAALVDGRLDPFRDVNAYPLDYSPYYVSPTPQFDHGSDVILKDATLRLAGPAWTLPAGPLMLSTLLQERDELNEAHVVTRLTREGVPRYYYNPEKGGVTRSAYVELTAPLVSAVNARPGILGLELQASYRHDSTDIFGREWGDTFIAVPSPEGPYPQSDTVGTRVDANQYTFGFRYQPVQQLALRASYGKGVLPPSISLLAPSYYSPFLISLIVAPRYTDPKRGGEFLSSLNSFGTLGSPTLRPEQSESISAGLVFTPDAIPGLRVSVDYTRIDKKDEISSINTQTLINLEDKAYSSRITRGPLTPADEALGYTGGPILAIDGGPVNVAKSLMEAFDVQADYTWYNVLGEFRASLIGTLQPHLQQQVLADEPTREMVGYYFGPLKLRGNIGLTWTRQDWSLGWNMQYYDSYLIYAPGQSGTTFTERYVSRNGSPTIGSQNYHDLFGRYRFGARSGPGWLAWLDNVEVLVSVKNVLDTEPPVLTNDNLGYFAVSPYGDPRLRSYAVTLSKSFQ